MSGAYTAKPAVAVLFYGPPGWLSTWPFSPWGPYPPGYTPSYQIALTADSSIVVGEPTSAVSLGLTDQGYETMEPTGSVTWTASIDGASVLLRLSDGPTLLSSVTTAYSPSSGFYGSAPSFYFDITAEDDAKTLVLSAVSTPFGTELSDTANITISYEAPVEAGIAVSPITAITYPPVESEGETAYTVIEIHVVLLAEPSHDVTIAVASSNTALGTVDASELVLNSDNWSYGVSFHLTGVADNTPGAGHSTAYAVEFSVAVSDDSRYNGIQPTNVSVTDIKECDPTAEVWSYGAGLEILASGVVVDDSGSLEGLVNYEGVVAGSVHYPVSGGTAVMDYAVTDPGGARTHSWSLVFEVDSSDEKDGTEWHNVGVVGENWECGIQVGSSPTNPIPTGAWSDNVDNVGRTWRIYRISGGMLDGCGVCQV